MDFVNKRITVFGDSIGKGITTDGGRIEVLPTYAIKLFENEYGVKIENLSAFGNSLKRFASAEKSISISLRSIKPSKTWSFSNSAETTRISTGRA